MNELSEALYSLHDPRSVLQAAAERLGPRLGVSRVALGEFFEETAEVEFNAEWRTDGIPFLMGRYPVPRDVELFKGGPQQQVIAIEDCALDRRTAGAFAVALDRRWAIKSLVLITRRIADRVTAVLYINNATPRRWTEDEIGLIREVAERTEAFAEQAKAQSELRRLNALLARQVEARTRERDRLFELSGDLLAVVGFDGELKIANPAWSKLLGFPPERILGAPLVAFVHPDDRSSIVAAIETFKSGGAVEAFEARLVGADERTAWVSWMAVSDEESIYAVGRDATREREREEALRQAQKMEAVGQLTGGIAHDFNNLLGAVVGSLELIRRKADDVERVRRWAELGIAAAERGAKLTTHLLAFSRTQKMEQQTIVVAKLIDGMLEMLRRTLGPMIRLRFEQAKDGASVRNDPTQLEMAVLNLALNARDAMPDGGDITIRTRRLWLSRDPELPAGEYLEIAVTDNGAGMSPDVLTRALDPFFTTKPVGKGTGLGLAQVYGVARQGDGSLRLESVAGKGTTARILLPIVDPDQSSGSAEIQTALSAQGGGRALVIDDDSDMRRSLRESLEVLGYQVSEAADGEAGLSALDRERPDILIVDFAMPGMTGAEVASAARERRPDLPMVLVSGFADTAFISERIGDLAILLCKPFRIEALQRAIKEAMSKAASNGSFCPEI